MREPNDGSGGVQPISILLVDDHTIWRDGIRTLLEHTEFIVVGEAASGTDAVEVARQVAPRLTLLDIRMAGGDGFEALKALKALDPPIAVVMLTTYESPTFMARAVAGGAAGYLLKGSTRQEILHALRTVADGGMLLSPKDLMHSLGGISEKAAGSLGLPHPLSARELDVLRLLATGLNNKDIAQVLYITTGTVKTHIEHILQKLNVSDRVQAAVWATRHGIIRPEES